MANHGFRVLSRPARRIVGVDGARLDVFDPRAGSGAPDDAKTIESTALGPDEAEAIVAKADEASRPERLPTIRPSFHDLPPLPPVEDASTTGGIERPGAPLAPGAVDRSWAAPLPWAAAALVFGSAVLSAVVVADVLLLRDYAAALPASALVRQHASGAPRVGAATARRDAVREVQNHALRRPAAWTLESGR